MGGWPHNVKTPKGLRAAALHPDGGAHEAQGRLQQDSHGGGLLGLRQR